MTTPIYKGKAQPPGDSGWLAGLGSWFSGSAPAYAGRGQATQASSGYFGGATPAYKPAPSADGAVNAPDAVTAGAIASAVTECPVEPERITVLIPRELIEPQ